MNVYGRIFTSENLALMRQMAAQGCSAREIAHAIGSTPNTGPAFVAGEGTPQALIIVPVGAAHQ